MKQGRIWLGIALLSSAAACGGGPTPADQPTPTGSASAWIRVENQTFNDLNIGVVGQDGARQRLGRSTANTSVIFRVPPTFVTGRARLRFSLDPVGRAQASFTRELDMIPGDTVVMIIPPA
ncbi:MAG TPA: hypothetical protein VFO95_04465 [Gemmatimonadales bacterium]|nr:hypothetical protein [Gemmatimonadales bacterium]